MAPNATSVRVIAYPAAAPEIRFAAEAVTGDMKKTALLFLVLLFPLTLLAAPDPKLRELDFLVGSFRCTGTAFASPMAPQHATSAEVTSKWENGGYWLAATYAEKKTADNAMPFRFTGYFGYDAEMKKLVVGGVDNMGGYSTGASDGISGDAIVFSGPWHMNGMTANSRDTFRNLGGGKISHTGEIEMDGKWMKMGEETCTKK